MSRSIEEQVKIRDSVTLQDLNRPLAPLTYGIAIVSAVFGTWAGSQAGKRKVPFYASKSVCEACYLDCVSDKNKNGLFIPQDT